jgi:hypothetical protein
MSFSITTGSVVDLRHIDADPDPTYPDDADPYPDIFEADPDPSFQIPNKGSKPCKCSDRLIFHTVLLSTASFCGSGCALDADPGSQNDADSVES